MGALLACSILLPIIGGAAIYYAGFTDRKKRETAVLAVVVPVSVWVILMSLNDMGTAFTLLQLTKEISISFRIDGLGRIFALLVSVLWPLASIYSFEYMSHEHRENTFFVFYTMTFGVTLGICFAANLITMYMFYELLTLITLPLIMHERDEAAHKAGMKYIIYSIGGATASFVGIMLFYINGGSFDFVLGGTFTGEKPAAFYAAFLLMFFGFGVKAAIFPLYRWLVAASVAPTPVTALLHAVAVVKAGTFAVIRVSCYSFGIENLNGSAVQKVALGFAALTIVFGSSMALKEHHFKRRLAYSTVANLSYILFGAMLMTPEGVTGGLMHMLFHGVIKITLFFVAGIVNIKTHRYSVDELEGFGKKMPKTFALFTAASLALIGIPPLCGFVSKFYIGRAAVSSAGLFPYLGIAALLISAILTAMYLLPIVVNAFFPSKSFKPESLGEEVRDPNGYMLWPLVIFVTAIIFFGLKPQMVLDFVNIF